jgi:hypothetical protein
MARDGVFLFVTVTGGPTSEIELGSEPVVIGREEGCRVTIDRPYVSRRHAEVRPRGKGYELVDLGARNPITVNGVALQERRPLTSGALIRFGPDAYVEFWDHRKDVATTALLDSSPPRSSAAEARSLREAGRPANERDAPRALLVTTLHNARQIAGIEAAASHVFRVHRGILEEELKRVAPGGRSVEARIADDGCVAELADAATAVACALAVVARVERYNHEHPSLKLRVSAAVAGTGGAAGAEPVLPSELLLTATALLRRANPQEVLVTERVAALLAGDAAVETHERGLFALAGEAPHPIHAVVPRQPDLPEVEERTLRTELPTAPPSPRGR